MTGLSHFKSAFSKSQKRSDLRRVLYVPKLERAWIRQNGSCFSLDGVF